MHTRNTHQHQIYTIPQTKMLKKKIFQVNGPKEEDAVDTPISNKINQKK